MGKCRHPIDETALLRFCRARVPGFPRACASLDVDQFAHGQSNPTYKILALTRRGDVCGTYVVRKKPAGTLLKSAHAVEREYAVMRALRTTNVPTPDALALCEDARVLGEAFYVMSYVDGDIYLRPRMEECSERRRGAVYEKMARTLGALHAVDPRAVGLGDFGKAERYGERQTERWAKQYEASVGPGVGVHAEESMMTLIAWLRSNAPRKRLAGGWCTATFDWTTWS